MSHIIGGVSWALQGNTTRAFNASALVGNSQQTATTTRAGSVSTTAGPRESAQCVLNTVSCCEIWIIQKRSTSGSVASRPGWLLFGMGVLHNLFLCNWYLMFWIPVSSIYNPNEPLDDRNLSPGVSSGSTRISLSSNGMINGESLRNKMLLEKLSDFSEPENWFQRLHIYMFVTLYL